MRITFVLPEATSAGGVRVVAIYAQKLKDRGHQVIAVSTPRREPTLRDRLRVLVKQHKWLKRKPRGVCHFDQVDVEHHIIDRWRPIADADVPDADAVVATWWETVEWVWALAPSKGVKTQFIQDYEIWHGFVERVDATCRLPIPKITTAQWLVKLLADKFAFTDVTLAPNAVDLERFHAPPRGKQPVPTVGLTYTTFRNKGADIAIEACNIARREIPELKVVSFGSSRLNEALPLPEGAQYFHHAPDDKLRDIYASCDAWLFGTRIEGFGLPILEAMACRTPVIGTPAGAAPELLADGAGIPVPPEDPAAMARQIIAVAKMNDADWRALSDRAYQRASRYTWDDATDLFEAALRGAVQRGTGATVAL
ncbi:MAG TPA: glycosyltransferase family 4 protein [Tepidisphaeraceae bacterium]|nr:glycosyltransferase family 4 protein [Tepidisphaeraceae bacterium]